MSLDTPALLAYYESLLSLLQRLSQTKNGAICVLNSGLFQAVHESRLFAADPDIGIGQEILPSLMIDTLLTLSDIDNPDALQRYYDLLLSTIRLIVHAVFSRGIENEQIKAQTRGFLVENRPCMAGIFKRSAKIGGNTAHEDSLCELVKAFIALIAATDFMEVCDIVALFYSD